MNGMSKRKRVSLLLAVSLVICIMSCGEASAASKKINLSKKKVTLNEKESCKISLKTANRKRIKWYSSNKKIVTVKNGLIKARATGRCVVTAKYEGKKYTCDVCVKGAGNVSKSPVVNTVPPAVAHTVPPIEAHAVPPVAASAAPTSPPSPPSMVPTVTSDPNGDAGQDHWFSDIKDYDGVVLEANKDVSNKDLLLLKIVNRSGADIVTGCSFMLEYYDGSQWTPVCFKEGVAFIAIGIIVRDGGEYAESMHLEQYFDGLSNGRYRITKEIWWASDRRTIQAEFMIGYAVSSTE